ncbi:cell number regulator 6-like [Bidens hawaiensis]|uniref:cell number regulator 6-like n=1 Tax=Bidens hawaiensis TaxID=980011 RepID=UPI0040490E25
MGDKSYVKLTKEQESSLQDVTPGELNQPIDVHQLNARRCPECGQALPSSYEPPADEDWSTGLLSCADDSESCMTGLFCPCVLFGRNIETLNEEIPANNACMCHALCVEGGMALAGITACIPGIDPGTLCLLTECLFFAWWMCGIYTGMARQTLQRKYHLKNSPCDPCAVHCCLHWCALCQEHREMKVHLADSVEETLISPPSIQEMKPIVERNEKDGVPTSSSHASSSQQDGENAKNTELQVVTI